jgi:proline iminopeptidase
MRVAVNGAELYLDVEEAALVPGGQAMRERPSLVLLHGGPGFDHACFKPYLAALADIAQLVYRDLRGQGRSGRPPLATCTLERMADDVAALCRVPDIRRRSSSAIRPAASSRCTSPGATRASSAA